MTKTPHKHAALIKAWADGAKIQWKDPWHGWVDWVHDIGPSWGSANEYRIKPEPKPDKVWYSKLTAGCGTYNTSSSFSSGFNHNIKHTHDGETNELKSVEIIK